MNYKKQYANLIKKAKRRENLQGYFEKHHIKPRALGGSDSIKNIVKLTAREHFIAHLLLVKMYPNNFSLIKAVNMMCVIGNKQLRCGNRMYSWLRTKFSKEMSRSQKGAGNSQYNTIWVTNGKINKKIHSSSAIPTDFYIGRVIPEKKDKILKVLDQKEYGRRIVKDLGLTINGVRKAVLECRVCKRHDTINILTIKNKKGELCKSCSHKT